MKHITFLGILSTVLLYISCTTENQKHKTETVKTISVKTESLQAQTTKETKSFYGTLQFLDATNFVAQETGTISKLNVVAGQKVKRGEILVVYPSTIHQLQIAQAKIQQDKVQQDYKRQQALYKAGAVTQASVTDLKNSLDVGQKALEQLHQVNVIKAPFSGTITQVHVHKGQEIMVDTPMFSIAKTHTVEVNFFVSPKDVYKIQQNNSVFFMHNGKKITGKITKKAIQIDDKHKAYLLTATFIDSGIKNAGETVDILVETDKENNRVWIPSSSLKQQNDTTFVYLAKHNKAHKQWVKVGNRTAKLVEILKGLQQGDLLITAGSNKLKPNDNITLIK